MEPQLYTHTLSHTHNTKDPHFLPKRTSAKHIKKKANPHHGAEAFHGSVRGLKMMVCGEIMQFPERSCAFITNENRTDSHACARAFVRKTQFYGMSDTQSLFGLTKHKIADF